MNNLLRNIVRSNPLKFISTQIQPSLGIQSVGARSLWHMSKPVNPTQNHKCCGFGGCSCRTRGFASTTGEKALIDFLAEEIEAEKASLADHLPSQINGFQIKYDGAEVELSKQSSSEKISIKFNVNHTVDECEDDLESDPQQQAQQDGPKLLSRPNFEVDIVKKDITLSMSCVFLTMPRAEGEYNDIFGIEDLTIYKGAHNDKVYACSGDVLDGYLYDLLMNLLAEKGVSDEFVHKISEVATQYEQSLFVNLLKDTKKFFEV